RLLDVEDLAAQRQDRLELAVAALLRRAAGGVALDDVDLAEGRVLLLAVGELAGQPHAVEDALPARHLARLAGRLAGARGVDDLAADDPRVGGILLEVVGERLADDLLDRPAHLARDELVLGLARELGLRHLDREHARQALAHVVAADLDLRLLGELVVLDVLVDDARHRRAQAREVGAAVALRDVVGEAEDVLAVAVVPLHRHFAGDRRMLVAVPLAGRVEDIRVEHLLAGVDELDEALDAAGEREVVGLVVALVDQPDAHAVVEKAQLAQALREDVVVEVDVREDLEVGQEVDLGAALLGLAGDLHRRDLDAVLLDDLAVLRDALAKLHVVRQAVAADRQAQPLRQPVDAADANAVQAARD